MLWAKKPAEKWIYMYWTFPETYYKRFLDKKNNEISSNFMFINFMKLCFTKRDSGIGGRMSIEKTQRKWTI
ncbi:unnamed protein product [Blepharisma stoltei]|uniref:Uncharacterized protein n=1 Tax=Blepharisma stoltei TaxID=1481888 RepID=A0AAU9II75_9CILI|nr:unnamed protein product [Blepharisma stoltei]